jgi:hypothetical protein
VYEEEDEENEDEDSCCPCCPPPSSASRRSNCTSFAHARVAAALVGETGRGGCCCCWEALALAGADADEEAEEAPTPLFDTFKATIVSVPSASRRAARYVSPAKSPRRGQSSQI